MEIERSVLLEIERIAPGRVHLREPMAKHTSFGLGGPADLFIEPGSSREFHDVLSLLAHANIPSLVLGRGTNLLVRSGGIDGAVVSTEHALTEIRTTDGGVAVGAGVSLKRLLLFCAEVGLSGIEGLSGIPGSVGGGVVTNAGSFGDSIGARLAAASIFEPGHRARRVPAEELAIAYRKIGLPEGSVLEGVELTLERSDAEAVAAKQQETLKRKWQCQPSGMRCAGCVFKNVPEAQAGRIIDEAGLKGARVGGAVVSDLHANFILNDRAATADDVEELIRLVRETVREKTGLELELEIQIVGRRGGGGNDAIN